jgi:hypothetical protein
MAGTENIELEELCKPHTQRGPWRLGDARFETRDGRVLHPDLLSKLPYRQPALQAALTDQGTETRACGIADAGQGQNVAERSAAAQMGRLREDFVTMTQRASVGQE